MASPQVGVYFAIGLVAGFIISFILSSFSTGYQDFTKMSPAGTQRMVAASQSSIMEDINNSVITNTDRPPDVTENPNKVQSNPQVQECNCTNVQTPPTCSPQVLQKPVLSHKELDDVNKLENITSVRDFDKEDHHKHQDNDAVAQDLYKNVRILVWVMTQPENLEKKARHVNATWGKRANKILFASDVYDKNFPTIPITIKHGRDHLTAKTMAAFDYVYKNYVNDFDWFMKADDDTYVIMENLRYFLTGYDPNEPVFFGHLFKVIVKQGYYSGGGGYVLSKEALKRFGRRTNHQCSIDWGAEDVEFGRCMEKLGIKTQETIDNLGRTRFHCFNPQTHLRGGYPDWFRQYDKYDGKKKGADSISDYAITFHYVSIQDMYDLEFFVYHLRPYGIQNGLQDLNVKRSKFTQTGDLPAAVIERLKNEKLNDIER